MLQAVKGGRRFVATVPWKDLIISRFGVMGAAETDDEIVAAARDSIVTVWHPTSSARMSPKGAKFGVVDPDLVVKGIDGLRIVDASVFVGHLLCDDCSSDSDVAEFSLLFLRATLSLRSIS